MPLIAGFFHGGVAVSDMERSLAFYRDALELEVHFDVTLAAVDYVRSVLGVEMRDARVVYLRIPGSDGVFVELLEYHGTDGRSVTPRAWDPGTGHLCFHVADAQALLERVVGLGFRARSERAVEIPGRPQQGRPRRLSARPRRLPHRALPTSTPGGSMTKLHLSAGDLPRLPIQAIGSAGIPSWMWLVRDAFAEGKLGPSDIEESLKDGVETSLLDMTEAGYDIVSDGEMLRADFTRNFHGRIKGLEAIDYERRLGYPGPDQLDAFRATGPLTVPEGYGLVREVEYLQTRTKLPFVSALQGPVTQAFRIDPGSAYKDKGGVAWALVPFINAELKAAVAAGATLIQLDEPAFWIMPGGLPEMVAIANACLEGVDATTSLHLCFGNFRGRPATSYRSYAAFAPHFGALAFDALSLEFANRSMWETELWAEHGGDKILVAGIIDVKARDLETPQMVAGRIRTLLRSVRPDKLWLSADCGYSQTARGLSVEKMRSLAAGARIVRAELAAG